MKTRTKNQKGIAHLGIIFIIVGLLFTGYKVRTGDFDISWLNELLVPQVEVSDDLVEEDASTSPKTGFNRLLEILPTKNTPEPTLEPSEEFTTVPQKPSTSCPRGGNYCLDSNTLELCFEETGEKVQIDCSAEGFTCSQSINWCD